MCPDCGSFDLVAEPYDYGLCPETGYRDAGERFRCRDCGARGDAEDVLPPELQRNAIRRQSSAGPTRKTA